MVKTKFLCEAKNKKEKNSKYYQFNIYKTLILFLTLKTFSATGGIEKVSRVAGMAINEYAEAHQEKLSVISMHDKKLPTTKPYFPSSVFIGMAAKRIAFIIRAWRQGIRSRVVVLSHINLLLPGYLIKFFSGKTKLVLIAHGIEVWQPLSPFKQRMLKAVDLMLPVSHFTKEKMKLLFHLPEEKLQVLNNCLDPFLPTPATEEERINWRSKYQLKDDDRVLMTLSRLSAKEKNKGYDKVLESIRELRPLFPNLKYVFVGKYDEEEKNRVEQLAVSLGISDALIFTGFVPDSELAFYYNMADVYIMPSEKEGFGITFIEAMYYHLPVIAGNRDGTTDALANGQLGTLVDPRSQEAITAAIHKVFTNLSAFVPDRNLLMERFSYEVYKDKWKSVLGLSNPK
ncbi:MAG: glycosyltransferase family 4 protein [Bacteroidota bacterium]|nr:glycosyltransferase family 4 protein [Bacteroidota bacterium]